MKIKSLVLFAAAMLFACSFRTSACSRVVLVGKDSLVIVGRTLDWKTPIPTNLYVYPRGMEKTGMPSGNTLKWVSKYATVLAVSYDGGATEGMNEKGLVMNGLFCKGTKYGSVSDGKRPVLSLAVFISYFLDNFATVAEVQKWLSSNNFVIYGQDFDGGTEAALHWALTDRSGVTMIMEYENGELHTYVSRDYRVLTNDPPFNDMLAINDYWKRVGGTSMLPGTVRSSDRFVRASFFIEHVPSDVDYKMGAAEVFSVLGNVSVPLGYGIAGEPNLSSTQWQSVADSRNLLYYFCFTTQFSRFWIDLSSLNISKGAPVLKLDTSGQKEFHGCVNELLKSSAPFTPMW